MYNVTEEIHDEDSLNEWNSVINNVPQLIVLLIVLVVMVIILLYGHSFMSTNIVILTSIGTLILIIICVTLIQDLLLHHKSQYREYTITIEDDRFKLERLSNWFLHKSPIEMDIEESSYPFPLRIFISDSNLFIIDNDKKQILIIRHLKYQNSISVYLSDAAIGYRESVDSIMHHFFNNF